MKQFIGGSERATSDERRELRDKETSDLFMS